MAAGGGRGRTAAATLSFVDERPQALAVGDVVLAAVVCCRGLRLSAAALASSSADRVAARVRATLGAVGAEELAEALQKAGAPAKSATSPRVWAPWAQGVEAPLSLASALQREADGADEGDVSGWR